MMLKKIESNDGVPIAVYRSGKGPPLILVHGGTSDHNRWMSVLGFLENHFTVYAVDRRELARAAMPAAIPLNVSLRTSLRWPIQ